MQQQKLCLKWHNHSLNFSSEFQTFRQKDILVDVTISCEGRNIKAHKMILSACSPYFQDIFSENPCQHPIVIINGMKYEDIMSILSFMYKGEVNVSHDGLSSFLQAAEALKVKGLAEVCGEKKSATSTPSQEKEPVEPARPQRTETPNKRRHRNRKRSFSDDEGGPARKSKEPLSPEIHELSGDESYVSEDRSASKQQQANSRRPQNTHSRSHHSSNVISNDEDMDDDYEIEPSKLLEQTLTTENVSVNNATDNSLRIDRISGNATEVEPTSIQEPESPPDIKPVVDFGESSTGGSEGNMVVFNEQSQPGPSSAQEMRDSSPTQGIFFSNAKV